MKRLPAVLISSLHIWCNLNDEINLGCFSPTNTSLTHGRNDETTQPRVQGTCTGYNGHHRFLLCYMPACAGYVVSFYKLGALISD